jgi:uncharacterized protein YxjI
VQPAVTHVPQQGYVPQSYLAPNTNVMPQRSPQQSIPYQPYPQQSVSPQPSAPLQSDNINPPQQNPFVNFQPGVTVTYSTNSQTRQINKEQLMAMLNQHRPTGTPTHFITREQFMSGAQPQLISDILQGVAQRLAPTSMQNQVRKFNIKTAFFSLSGGDMTITDENNQPVFKVIGQWSLTTDFEVLDARTMQSVCKIGQDLISIRDTFRVHHNSKDIAKCVKKITMFKDHYEYTRLDNNDKLDVNGDLREYHFNVRRGEQITATIEKAVWTQTDCYGLTVLPNEDVLHHICIVIIIERELEERRRREGKLDTTYNY